MDKHIGDRIRERRGTLGLNQPQLGKLIGRTKGAVSQWESGTVRPDRDSLLALAKALKCSTNWLMEGKEDAQDLKGRYVVDSNAEMIGMEVVEGDPLPGHDEVMLPVFREVEFAAGDGATQVIENHGIQERFSLARLSRANVNPANAALAVAKGDSMTPAIHDGATLGIDKGTRHIIDGKVYALDHDGMLRVKRLYRLPLNRVRLVSENAAEYPEEVYSLGDSDAPRIIGKVFWWENFD